MMPDNGMPAPGEKQHARMKEVNFNQFACRLAGCRVSYFFVEI